MQDQEAEARPHLQPLTEAVCLFASGGHRSFKCPKAATPSFKATSKSSEFRGSALFIPVFLYHFPKYKPLHLSVLFCVLIPRTFWTFFSLTQISIPLLFSDPWFFSSWMLNSWGKKIPIFTIFTIFTEHSFPSLPFHNRHLSLPSTPAEEAGVHNQSLLGKELLWSAGGGAVSRHPQLSASSWLAERRSLFWSHTFLGSGWQWDLSV